MSRLTRETRLEVGVREVATRSWNVLTRPLPAPHVAALTVSTIAAAEGAVLLGRFQRGGDASALHPGAPRLRRASGGTHLWITEGSVHVLLALAMPDALVACAPASLVNRHVRPVLRAVGGAYFGRDWIAGARGNRAPVGFAGFAHDASTGRAALEVLLPARSDWCDPSRGSHRGLTPSHLEEPARFVDAIVAAFEAAFGPCVPFPGEIGEIDEIDDQPPPADETPWAASIDEAMGPVRAGRDDRGVLQLGGEIFASVDRVLALGPAVDAEAAVNADASNAGALVDAAFTNGPGVIVGVNDLAHVRDVLLEARLQHS